MNRLGRCVAERAKKVVVLCLAPLLGAAAMPPVREAALQPLPAAFAVVSDGVGVLSLSQRQGLAKRIEDVARKTGATILIVVVPTVRPETIEAYVQRLSDHWQRERRLPSHRRFIFIVAAKADAILRIVPSKKLGWVLRPLQESGRVLAASTLLAEDRYYDGMADIVDVLADLLGSAKTVRMVSRSVVHRRGAA